MSGAGATQCFHLSLHIPQRALYTVMSGVPAEISARISSASYTLCCPPCSCQCFFLLYSLCIHMSAGIRVRIYDVRSCCVRVLPFIPGSPAALTSACNWCRSIAIVLERGSSPRQVCTGMHTTKPVFSSCRTRWECGTLSLELSNARTCCRLSGM